MYSNALSIHRPQIGPKLHFKAEIFTKIGTDVMQNYVCLVFIIRAGNVHYSNVIHVKTTKFFISSNTFNITRKSRRFLASISCLTLPVCLANYKISRYKYTAGTHTFQAQLILPLRGATNMGKLQ